MHWWRHEKERSSQGVVASRAALNQNECDTMPRSMHAAPAPLQDVSTTRADFYLALPLRAADGERSSSVSPSGGRPADGGSSSGAALRQRRHGGGGAARGASTRCLAAEGGREVDVVFPSLRPRLSLLRQVYQQLSPLLAADLESLRQGGDVPGGGGGAPADQGLPPLSPLREEEVEESEVQ